MGCRRNLGVRKLFPNWWSNITVVSLRAWTRFAYPARPVSRGRRRSLDGTFLTHLAPDSPLESLVWRTVAARAGRRARGALDAPAERCRSGAPGRRVPI
jgi:hypothetical protein